MEAPAACGNDAGKRALLVLGAADISLPLAIVALGSEVDNRRLSGERRICGPAVLLSLGAIGGEMVEIGEIGIDSHLVELVQNLI